MPPVLTEGNVRKAVLAVFSQQLIRAAQIVEERCESFLAESKRFTDILVEGDAEEVSGTAIDLADAMTDYSFALQDHAALLGLFSIANRVEPLIQWRDNAG